MKTIATVISASALVVASASVAAWGWGPDSGYGYDYPYYGYAPYGYAPYGYGVPVQPPAQLTAEQRKALEDQQARAFEYMQNVQRQMAQYYGDQYRPVYDMERRMFAERDAHMQEMNKLIQETQQDMHRKAPESLSQPPRYGFEPTRSEDATARQQEMEKQSQDYRKAAEERRAAYLKAAEQRRLDVQKRFEERRMERNNPADTVVAPKADVPKTDAPKADDKQG